MTPLSRFKLFHSSLPGGELEVENPVGWDTAIISLERDKEYHSLVEYFKGNFMWYGLAMRTFKTIENDYGPNAVVGITIDVSFKSGVFINLFTGRVKLWQLEEIIIADRAHYKMTIPIIRDDFWTKFINRVDSQINLEAAVDVDGNARTAINKIVLPMPSQKIKSLLTGSIVTTQEIPSLDFPDNRWLQVDNTVESVSEIRDKYSLFCAANSSIPVNIITALYDGTYQFDFQFEISDLDNLGAVLPVDPGFGFDMFYQLNGSPRVAFAKADTANSGDSTNPGFTRYTYNTGLLNLTKGEVIRVYGETTLDFFKVIIWGTDGLTFSSSDGDLNYPTGAQGSWITGESNTIYQETLTDAYLIKDAAESIISKLVGQNAAVKSDYLDTCKGHNAIFRGKHIRGNDFATKQLSMSFEEWWKGANPLLFLGLGYTTVLGVKKIEIEDRAFFYNPTPEVNISNVNKLVRRYDLERIYKSIEIGYKKWSSESDSGVDDPQTIRHFNSDLEGEKIIVKCDWMAASLAIERSRRNRIELGKDDRNDEEIMVVALVPDGDDWLPEFGTVFNAITNLINSDFRINIRHSATRLFKRWQAWFNGCMVYSDTGLFTFNRGEGNYEMTSQFETTDCEATDDPEPVLDENADIAADTDNKIFVPRIYEAEGVPMSFSTYQDIVANKNKALGVSRTNADHVPMHIIDLGFEIFKSQSNMILLQATEEGL